MNNLIQKKIFISLIILCGVILNNAHADSKLNCNGLVSVGSGASIGGCFFKDMPLYNQRIVSSMHCVPTAASMALDNLLINDIDFSRRFNVTKSINWLNKTYIPTIQPIDKINAMGNLMGTTASGGTGGTGADYYPALSTHFKDATSEDLVASSNDFTNEFFAETVADGKSGFMVYAPYTENCNQVGLSKICSYTKAFGHAVAVNGYYGIGDITALNIFNPFGAGTTDPNGGIEEMITIEPLELYSAWSMVDLRPHGDNTNYVYEQSGVYRIIEAWRSIATN